MRKVRLQFVLIGVLSLVACPAVGAITHYANPYVGQKVVFNYAPDPGGNSGGPFVGTLYNPVATWTTFCVEADDHDELFTPDAQYVVNNISPTTATASGNYVTDEAKWLYYESLHDPSQLPGYVPGNSSSDTELQEAIWAGVLGGGSSGKQLSDPSNSSPTPLDPIIAGGWYADAVTAVTKYPDGPWVTSVWVLNPDTSTNPEDSPQVQSMLYEVVPEPATMIVWSLLGAASWLGMSVVRKGRRVGRQPWSPEARSAILEIVERGRGCS
jgi:hypothetical protein